VLTLPADNGTWGVGLITSSQDAALRPAKEPDVWESILRQLPFAAHWLDGEPLEERPLIIAKIEDRHRDFVVDGRPVAPGVLPVGDSWACTNPSVGRGISIGAIHAVALRDFLREDVSDRVELSLGWHDVTMRTVEPYFRSTLSFDRHRLAEMEALIEGREPPTDDEWEITKALAYAGGSDPDCLRAFIDVASALATPEDVLGPVLDKVIEHGAGWRDAPDVGPSRADLVAMASRS
jgi:flavin-dependent dehydrogenase